MRLSSGLSLTSGLAALGVCVGCQFQPPVVHLPEPPTAQESTQLASARSRVLPLAKDKVFARLMGTLMDMGYQVRCASQELGQVNITSAWKGPNGEDLSVEATLLFQATGPDTTSVRMNAAGQWSQLTFGKSSAGTLAGAAPSLDSAECQAFLDQLVARLCPAK